MSLLTFPDRLKCDEGYSINNEAPWSCLRLAQYLGKNFLFPLNQFSTSRKKSQSVAPQKCPGVTSWEVKWSHFSIRLGVEGLAQWLRPQVWFPALEDMTENKITNPCLSQANHHGELQVQRGALLQRVRLKTREGTKSRPLARVGITCTHCN